MKSFLRWVETEEFAGISEPQHKKGESRMDLDEIVERRIKSIVEDLKEKGTEREILGAISNYMKKTAAASQTPPPQQNLQVQNPAQQAAQPEQPAVPAIS